MNTKLKRKKLRMVKNKTFNFPTILTLTRIFLVGPLMIFMFSDNEAFRIPALICFVVAALTDKLDGDLARKNNQVTELGKFLDPLADKMLVNLTFFALVMKGIVAPWVFGVILIRDFAVDGMRMMVARKGETVAASMIGKSKTMTQMIGLTIIMLSLNLSNGVLLTIGTIIIYIAVALTLWSGADYLTKGYKKAIKA